MNKNTKKKASPNGLPRIKKLREERGWTATQLAIASRVALSSISLLERGAEGLGRRRAIRLAAALGVNVSDLY